MLDPDRRRKMISLRLSEAEYELLKTHYRTYGARNISDFARLALQRIATGSAVSQNDFAAKLSEFDARLNTLESHVSLLLERGKVMS
jgi:hypothetical protein